MSLPYQVRELNHRLKELKDEKDKLIRLIRLYNTNVYSHNFLVHTGVFTSLRIIQYTIKTIEEQVYYLLG